MSALAKRVFRVVAEAKEPDVLVHVRFHPNADIAMMKSPNTSCRKSGTRAFARAPPVITWGWPAAAASSAFRKARSIVS
jgi:hypothetical protein